jgi:hypothetical protein
MGGDCILKPELENDYGMQNEILLWFKYACLIHHQHQ